MSCRGGRRGTASFKYRQSAVVSAHNFEGRPRDSIPICHSLASSQHRVLEDRLREANDVLDRRHDHRMYHTKERAKDQSCSLTRKPAQPSPARDSRAVAHAPERFPFRSAKLNAKSSANQRPSGPVTLAGEQEQREDAPNDDEKEAATGVLE